MINKKEIKKYFEKAKKHYRLKNIAIRFLQNSTIRKMEKKRKIGPTMSIVMSNEASRILVNSAERVWKRYSREYKSRLQTENFDEVLKKAILHEIKHYLIFLNEYKGNVILAKARMQELENKERNLEHREKPSERICDRFAIKEYLKLK